MQLQIDVQDNDAQLYQSHALITALVFQKIGPQGPFSHRPGPAPAQCGGVARGPPGRPANHVPKTLQDRKCWACWAGNVGTRSYGGAMPIGMVTYALMRA